MPTHTKNTKRYLNIDIRNHKAKHYIDMKRSMGVCLTGKSWLQPWEIKIITRHCWHRLRLFYLAKRCNMISAWYILWAWRIWNSSLLIDSRQGTLRSTHANHSQNGHFTQHIFSVWLQQLFSVWPRSTHANLKAWSRSYKGSSFRTNPFYWNEKKTKKV